MRRTLSVLFLGIVVGLSGPVLAQEARETSQHAADNVVDSLEVEEADDGTYVRISGNSEPTFSVFKLTDPLRLFVDVSSSQLDGEALTERVGNGVISKVALIDLEENSQPIARLIIGFDKAAHYDVNADGNDVVVFIDGKGREKGSENVAQIQKKLEKVESEYRSQLDDSENRYKTAKSELSRTREQLESAQQRLEQLHTQLAEADADQRGAIEERIEKQSEQLQSTRDEIAKREQKADRLESELGKLREERDAAVARLDEVKARLTAERKAAEKRADKLAGELGSTRQALDSVATEKDQLKSRLDEMAAQAEQSSERVEEQVTKLNAARERQQQLEGQLTELRASLSQGDESVRGELEKLEAEKSQLNSRLSTQMKALEQARTEAKSANERVASLQNLVEQHESEVARLRGELEQARAAGSERDQAQADLDKLRTRLEREQQQVAAIEGKRAAEQKRLAKLADQRNQAQAELAETERQIEQRRQRLNSLTDRDDLPAAKAVAIDPERSNHVRDIRLETTDGRSRIVVELDRPSNFETLPANDSRAVMLLNGVELPKELERTLSPDAQGGAIRFVSSFTDDNGQVRMEAELGDETSEMVRQDGNTVVWEFAPAVASEKAHGSMAAAGQPKPTKEGKSFTSAPPNYPRTVADPTKVNTVPGMRKKRLTIDLREADIQNVLRLMAREGGVNIISGDGVGGSVTMRLRSVPLDQAFLTILQSQGLGFEVRGNVLRVAPQETLLEEQKARAEARARSEQLQPLEVFLLPINYADAGELQPQVEGLLSPRGSVTVDQRTNTLIIKDLADNLESVRALVDNLDSQVPQVLIEARIVETNDTFERQLGIQWGGDFSFAQGNGNPTGLVFPSVLGVAGGATDGETTTTGTASNPNFAVNLPAPAGTGAGGAIGLTMGSVGGSVNLNLRLSAMESQGHAKIVSSPRILTLDNTEATISQGTSIPISVVSAAGVQTVFVDATLELTVRPHVTPDGNVQMQITATKNEPDFQNTGARGDPTIIRKQAETELLIKDGDTTVIGGIYTRNSGSSLSAVPFFHKIPILGNIFKSTSTSERRTELLIFITPRIVNRSESLGEAAPSGSVSN
jgi:type IV pilus assembly protein PilQ